MENSSFDNQDRAEDREQMMSLLSAASSMKTDKDGNMSKHVELEEDVPMTFPQRLMEILSSDEVADVVSWLPHGKGFSIYKKKKFAAEILPVYFKQSKFTSFTRKLNRWGFTRVTRGPETGAYYHKYFQRGDLRLCMQMSCQSSKHQQLPVNGNNMSFGPAFGANQLFQSLGGNTLGAGSLAGGNFGGLGGAGAGNQDDIAQQNQSLIRHQLQQLQMQQMQLQQLQMQQQQQFQAAELMRHALAKQNGGDDAGETKADPSAMFLQTLQRAKESGNGLLGTHQQLALLPNLNASQGPTAMMGEPTRPAAGNGRAWAA